MSSHKLHCPSCEAEIDANNPNHLKVSGIYRSETGWSSTTGIYQSSLGGDFIPPQPAPNKAQTKIGTAIFAIFFLTGPLLAIWDMVDKQKWPEAIFVFGWFLFFAWCTNQLYRRGSSANHVAHQQYELRKKIWDNAYYCKVHDQVFDPITGIHESRTEFSRNNH